MLSEYTRYKFMGVIELECLFYANVRVCADWATSYLTRFFKTGHDQDDEVLEQQVAQGTMADNATKHLHKLTKWSSCNLLPLKYCATNRYNVLNLCSAMVYIYMLQLK
jgi:hypothetical protein